MMRARRKALLLVSTVLSLACPNGDDHRSGMVVAYAASGGAAREAGLLPGDRLLLYRRQAAPPANPRPQEGRLDSCAGIAELEVEQAPRGAVRIEVERGGERRSVLLPAGAWKVAFAGPRGDDACTAIAAALRADDAGHPAETEKA